MLNDDKMIISTNSFNLQFQATTALNMKTSFIISRKLNCNLAPLLVLDNMYIVQEWISDSLGKPVLVNQLIPSHLNTAYRKICAEYPGVEQFKNSVL